MVWAVVLLRTSGITYEDWEYREGFFSYRKEASTVL